MVPAVIVTEAVSRYLAELRSESDPVLAEMEAHGARDGIPIVVPETGALLHVLALASGARRVLEVGTAIGVSTLYLARALPDDGRVVSRRGRGWACRRCGHTVPLSREHLK